MEGRYSFPAAPDGATAIDVLAVNDWIGMPLEHDGKKPLGMAAGFPSYDAAKAWQVINRACLNNPAQRNHMGVLCDGEHGNGFIVLDCDINKETGDEIGIINLGKLLEEHKIRLPDTYVVRTPSGGYHFYFSINPDEHGKYKMCAGELAPGVDVKGWHGYTKCPLSVYGKPGPHEHDRYLPAEGHVIAPLPRALGKLLPKRGGKRKQPILTEPQKVTYRYSSRAEFFYKTKLEQLERLAREAAYSGGSRNTTINHKALFLYRFRQYIPEAQITSDLEDIAAEVYERHGSEWREILRSIQSARDKARFLPVLNL